VVTRLHAATIGVALLAVAGCAANSVPASSVSPSDYPPCATVWRAGHQVPRAYPGCRQRNGDAVTAVAYRCDNGRLITTYDMDWGYLGGAVHVTHNLPADPGYRAEFKHC
jgi:hypothetical protein